jgi:hypothetical protein
MAESTTMIFLSQVPPAAWPTSDNIFAPLNIRSVGRMAYVVISTEMLMIKAPMMRFRSTAG